MPQWLMDWWRGYSDEGVDQARWKADFLRRRNAPLPVFQAQGPPVSTWPIVLDTDWCGEGIDSGNGKTFSMGDSTTPAPGIGF
jgi:hypothetical protein